MQGFKAPGIEKAYLLYDSFLQKMDDRLKQAHGSQAQHFR